MSTRNPPVPAAPPAPRSLLAVLRREATPLDLRIVGRTLLHAVLVGAAAGAIGAVFFVGLELVQRYLLEQVAGYVPLRAHGETFLPPERESHPFRPWLIVLLPTAGALVSGLLTTRFAPEAQGGGGDAMIEAFHHRGGLIRRRVVWVKLLASIATLGSGGSGGREGPTMQLGGALGSTIGGLLRVGPRERRILLCAGVAAGMSAVFRAPLGAALLAVEVLYRDDFESDALVPSVLASVVSYAVVISLYGESTLFAHAPQYAFVAAHLPLYGLLAIFCALVAAAFLAVLRLVQRTTQRLPVPAWIRPGLGGLALGLVAAPTLWMLDRWLGLPGQGFGLLSGGYGAAQVAITGAPWLSIGWTGVVLLLVLCFAKLLVSSFTIGSGGSAGDFAPSLVLGALLGGAFGRAVQLLTHDPRIDPGAFALVGMGTFYGGIAHVPLSSLVFVCELAGSYDLLVPLMLAEGIAFLALRNRSLYSAQLPTRRDSPAHRDGLVPDALSSISVKDVVTRGRAFVTFAPATPASQVLREASDSAWQDAFPVIDEAGKLVGFVTSDALRVLTAEREIEPWMIAVDVMQPPVTIRETDDLRTATRAMIDHGLREVAVLGDDGRIVGFLDEADVARAYLAATGATVEAPDMAAPPG